MDSYKLEEAKLKSLVEPEVWELLKANNAIIAGGAITALFTSQEVNDLDVYLPSQRAVVNILAEAFNEEEYTETNDILGQFQMIFLNISDKSMTFKNQGQEIQFITFQYFQNSEEVFETFDFTCCMAAYDVAKEQFVFHPEFFKHNAQRYLKFNPGTAFPLMSTLRVGKYQEKGYEISKAEFLRVVMQCMNLKLESWEDLKTHIGGMYGYNMDEFFDEDKEFTVTEAIEQMSEREFNPEHRDSKKLFDFDKILEEFDPAEEVDIPEPPYREGYFYKDVNKDLTSAWCGYGGTKLIYEIGSVVNGGKSNGIFIHANPLEPWGRSDCCIELEPIGEYTIKHGGQYDRKKAQLFGDFRVVRVVPHWDNTLSKPLMKYRVEHELEKTNPPIKPPVTLGDLWDG